MDDDRWRIRRTWILQHLPIHFTGLPIITLGNGDINQRKQENSGRFFSSSFLQEHIRGKMFIRAKDPLDCPAALHDDTQDQEKWEWLSHIRSVVSENYPREK